MEELQKEMDFEKHPMKVKNEEQERHGGVKVKAEDGVDQMKAEGDLVHW